MAQRYKNTPTIADDKTRKHAFQTIINDYRSLPGYSGAVFDGICSVFCFLNDAYSESELILHAFREKCVTLQRN